MFSSSSKIASLCLAAVALSSGAHAEQEAAQTFGLLAAGLHGGVGLYGAGGVGLYGNGVATGYGGANAAWEVLAAPVSAAVSADPLVSEELRVSVGTAVLMQVPMWAALLAGLRALAELRALVEMEALMPVPVWEELAVRASALVPVEMLALA
ncbi:hypothetical protein PR002_g30087 [Phytophthora rubi]|uniref:RxLR effector protein n=1 Tax=Phytophthora rubi TaxID=129364 RepID=A0A6A3GVF0_9STRA|nr:hypothetical protein PR002_g30087 [Phytophthora rubi]